MMSCIALHAFFLLSPFALYAVARGVEIFGITGFGGGGHRITTHEHDVSYLSHFCFLLLFSPIALSTTTPPVSSRIAEKLLPFWSSCHGDQYARACVPFYGSAPLLFVYLTSKKGRRSAFWRGKKSSVDGRTGFLCIIIFLNS